MVFIGKSWRVKCQPRGWIPDDKKFPSRKPDQESRFRRAAISGGENILMVALNGDVLNISSRFFADD
jgi:hypothetical protein